MSEKWATGVMSQVGEKAREAAKKRKSAFEGATDEETRLGKRASIAADRPSSNSPVLSASSHTASLSRSGQSLWEYIRPYLNVFQYSQPPTKSWVRELLSLPRVRDLKFNPRRQSKRPFVDTDVKKVAALVLQLTGKPARLPCTRCLNGNGVFDGCIMLASNASVGTNIKNCANCWYSHQACTYETSVADDRTLEREAFSQVADGEMTDKPEVIQHVTYDSKHPYVEKTPAPAIHRSLSGRRYCDWPGKLRTNSIDSCLSILTRLFRRVWKYDHPEKWHSIARRIRAARGLRKTMVMPGRQMWPSVPKRAGFGLSLSCEYLPVRH